MIGFYYQLLSAKLFNLVKSDYYLIEKYLAYEIQLRRSFSE